MLRKILRKIEIENYLNLITNNDPKSTGLILLMIKNCQVLQVALGIQRRIKGPALKAYGHKKSAIII